MDPGETAKQGAEQGLAGGVDVAKIPSGRGVCVVRQSFLRREAFGEWFFDGERPHETERLMAPERTTCKYSHLGAL